MPQQSALILTLGGAPETWHNVDGLPGLYHPSIPAPLPDGLTVEQAKDFHADEGHPLSLVKVSDNKATQGANAQREALEALRGAPRRREGLAPVNPESLEGQRETDQAQADAAGEEA
jgi:hypothetical protein